MIAYIIEFSLLLGVFGIINFLLVRHSGHYDFRRKYLVISTLLSMIVPLVPSLSSNSIVVFSMLLPDVEIIAEGISLAESPTITNSQQSIITVLSYLYIIGAFFLAFKFITAGIKMYTIFQNGKKVIRNKRTVIYANSIQNPCSFFRTILLPAKIIFSTEELHAIIKHENIHIDLDHSVEKIFFELVKIICWWHPISWLYASDIELIHELQVDEFMEKQMNPNKYKEILLQLIVYPPHLRLAHSFSSNIKKRIQTMNQKKKKFNLRQLASLCIIALVAMLFIHSCTDTVENNSLSQTGDDNVITGALESKSYSFKTVDTLTTFDYETYEETVQITENNMTVYKEPDVMPTFPGCDISLKGQELKDCSNKEMLQFIYTHIKYPAEAKAKGIEGMIVVKFIVEKDGGIRIIEFIRKLGFGTEETVEDMLYKMNDEIKWNPGLVNGEPVNVEYTLPVKFKLEDK